MRKNDEIAGVLAWKCPKLRGGGLLGSIGTEIRVGRKGRGK